MGAAPRPQTMEMMSPAAMKAATVNQERLSGQQRQGGVCWGQRVLIVDAAFESLAASTFTMVVVTVTAAVAPP